MRRRRAPPRACAWVAPRSPIRAGRGSHGRAARGGRPRRGKALFALLALATAALATGGVWWLGSGATPLAGAITERLNGIGNLWDALAPFSEAGGLLWQKAGYPLAIRPLVLSMSCYLFWFGLGNV